VRVLVTGATGFVGSWVARELARRGHEVRALVRPTSSLRNLAGAPLERVEGDVLEAASVERALHGCDAVVHSAGVVHFLPGDARQRAVNAGSVEVVLGAALRAGVRRAVLTSSTAVMGGTPRPVVADESTPSNAEALGIRYFTSKLEGERAGMALHARGLPLVVVRPSVVLGPGDVYRSSAATVLAVARRRLPFYVDGGQSYCDVRDVATGHAEALERGRIGEAYVLGGANLTTGEMMERVAAIAGVPPPRRLPYAVALVGALAGEAWARLRGRAPKFPVQLVRSGHLYTYVSSGKARSELGYANRPFDDTVRDTLDWFAGEGRLERRA
jgi:dihydroflavonol-4-reductase